MTRLTLSAVWMAAALLATAMVGATVAEEPAGDNLQGSWNDYPAKNMGNLPDTAGFVTPGAEPQPPTTVTPPVPMMPPPQIFPPRQQQQGVPGGGGGGFSWGGKQGGGSFGGKQGGGFNWGKAKPPQGYQGAPAGSLDQQKLLEYIRQLQIQNAQLRELLRQMVERQAALNSERSTGLTDQGMPVE